MAWDFVMGFAKDNGLQTVEGVAKPGSGAEAGPNTGTGTGS